VQPAVWWVVVSVEVWPVVPAVLWSAFPREVAPAALLAVFLPEFFLVSQAVLLLVFLLASPPEVVVESAIQEPLVLESAVLLRFAAEGALCLSLLWAGK